MGPERRRRAFVLAVQVSAAHLAGGRFLAHVN
jgi:hypothetical protein